MAIVTAFGVSQVNDLSCKRAQQVDSLLTVANPVIFLTGDWSIEYRLAPNKIETVISNIGNALRFVPSHHYFIVSTKN